MRLETKFNGIIKLDNLSSGLKKNIEDISSKKEVTVDGAEKDVSRELSFVKNTLSLKSFNNSNYSPKEINFDKVTAKVKENSGNLEVTVKATEFVSKVISSEGGSPSEISKNALENSVPSEKLHDDAKKDWETNKLKIKLKIKEANSEIKSYNEGVDKYNQEIIKNWKPLSDDQMKEIEKKLPKAIEEAKKKNLEKAKKENKLPEEIDENKIKNDLIKKCHSDNDEGKVKKIMKPQRLFKSEDYNKAVEKYNETAPDGEKATKRKLNQHDISERRALKANEKLIPFDTGKKLIYDKTPENLYGAMGCVDTVGAILNKAGVLKEPLKDKVCKLYTILTGEQLKGEKKVNISEEEGKMLNGKPFDDITNEFKDKKTGKFDKSKLQDGDIVFFKDKKDGKIHHVGIVVVDKDGNKFVVNNNSGTPNPHSGKKHITGDGNVALSKRYTAVEQEPIDDITDDFVVLRRK